MFFQWPHTPFPIMATKSADTYTPELPGPALSEMKRISFIRHQSQIAKLGGFLLDNPKAKPSSVGEACFDDLYKKILRK
jgi:hypothetical protein